MRRRPRRRSGGAEAPVDVVLREDRRLTTVDNRRLAAARARGVDVEVLIHEGDEVLPDRAVAARFPHPQTGELPTTWGEALDNRLRKQGDAWSEAHPDGSYEAPRPRRSR